MRTNLIFCCSRKCLQKEMVKLVNFYSADMCKVVYPDTVFIGNSRYIFIININGEPKRLRGLRVHSFRTCLKYFISNEVMQCLIPSCLIANEQINTD